MFPAKFSTTCVVVLPTFRCGAVGSTSYCQPAHEPYSSLILTLRYLSPATKFDRVSGRLYVRGKMRPSPYEVTPSPYAWLLAKQRPTQAQPTQNAREPFSQLLTVGQARALLGTSGATIRRLIKSGTLRAIRFGPRGYHRIPISEIERLGALAKEHR